MSAPRATPWGDTTTAHGHGIFAVLGRLAEFERELIRARTGERRDRAKALGQPLGCLVTLAERQKREALARCKRGELLTAIARRYNVGAATISSLVV